MIGLRIKEYREGKGLKVGAFAKQIGISQGSLSDIENEKTKPSAETLAKIVRNTDIDPTWLLTGEKRQDAMQKIKGDGYFQGASLNGNIHINHGHGIVAEKPAGFKERRKSRPVDQIEDKFLGDWRGLSDVGKMRIWTLLKEEIEREKIKH